MNKLFTISAFVFITTGLILSQQTNAQTPERMSYQAIIRNSNDKLVVNTQIAMKLSILHYSVSGTLVYVETQTPTTNTNGLVSIEIGGGTGFDTIDWSNGPYFIRIETDPLGGTDYTITGVSQLLTVPYALHAKTAESISGTIIETQNLADVAAIENSVNRQLKNVTDPTDAQDAATKAYVDSLIEIINNKMLDDGRNGIVNDVDGNIYKTIKIGTQVWMAENLKTTKYSNGDSIGTTFPSTLDISAESTPKYQWAYNGNESNVAVYGRLYTWHAVLDSRNICPTGWHVPDYAEWTTLENFLIAAGYNYDGTTTGNKYAKAIASATGWTFISIEGAIGNTDYPYKQNESGFSALPGGYRFIAAYGFEDVGKTAIFWTSSESDSENAWSIGLLHYYVNVVGEGTSKSMGTSVRCLRD